MDGLLLDTDVVSFLFKRDTRAERYLPLLANHLLIVSFMTVAELDRWALAHEWGEPRRTALDAHIRRFIIHPFDRDLCRTWAKVIDMRRRQGRPIQCADAWIAATALHHDWPLVTHNAQDYLGINELKLLSITEDK